RFRQLDQPTPDHSVDDCSGCRVCNMACPTGVKIAEINARARAAMVDQGEVPGRLRLRNNLVARPELLGRLAGPVAPLANALFDSRAARWLAEVTLGIHRRAPLPRFAGERFRRWAAGRRPPGGATRKVVYFHGCSTDAFEPRVGRAAVRVLEHHGFEVVVPPQSCCGLPLLSNGEFSAARRYHQRNVARLAGWAREGYDIVGTSTSCTLTLKEEAPELLDLHGGDFDLVAAHTFDLSELLVGLWEQGELDTDLSPIPLALVYHPPCQYRAHRIGLPAMELLELIPELQVVESKAACCGIAGTYGYKTEKYQIAMDVGRPLFDLVREVDGPVALCDSETCRWQITHATGTPAVHPVELLAAAYRLPVDEPLQGVLAFSGVLAT
ncbi:MAG: anaerobic glycerol-3-phosphate dehydrogenase subunit C, partial [Acidimicrobiia bacterium]